MKYLALLTMGLVVSHCSYAQKYYPHPELYKFAGTWAYADSSQTFKVVLEVNKKVFKRISGDIIVGNYIYIKDNAVIVSTLDSTKNAMTEGFTWLSDSTIRVIFKDPIKQKDGFGFFTWSHEKDGDHLLWKLINHEVYIIGNSNKDWDPTFSVPTELKLHRICFSDD